MARIPDFLINSVGFLYKNIAEAEMNTRRGGSCFLIGKPLKGVTDDNGKPQHLIYAVTCHHLVFNSDAPVIRLKRRDGAKTVIELRQNDWVSGEQDDIAIAYLSDKTEGKIQFISFLETSAFLDESTMSALNLGIGDEVFMLRRFFNAQGTAETIEPALRLGSISIMPQLLWNVATNDNQISFAVEMKSRAGFSGSLVGVYRSQATNPFNIPGPAEWWRLLGVNWGHVIDRETSENTWLNGVVPAWKILELLETPALSDKPRP